MRKIQANNINNIKTFLSRVGKQVYSFGNRIYYVDYNGNPCKLTLINWG